MICASLASCAKDLALGEVEVGEAPVDNDEMDVRGESVGVSGLE
jgi:hypothetical protein